MNFYRVIKESSLGNAIVEGKNNNPIVYMIDNSITNNTKEINFDGDENGYIGYSTDQEKDPRSWKYYLVDQICLQKGFMILIPLYDYHQYCFPRREIFIQSDKVTVEKVETW